MTTLVDLLFRANTKPLDDATTKLDSVASAAKGAAPQIDGLGNAFGKLSNPVALATLGVVALAAGFLNLIKNTVAFADALGDLSEFTGIAVEELSIMEKVGRDSGTSFETITTAVVKFTKSMADAQDPTSEQGKILKQLGLDGSASLDQVAKALAQYEAGVGKAHATMAFFGKQGHEINEWLTDYANRGEVAADITKKQAEEADKLGRAWNSLSSTMASWLTSIATPVISALARIAAHLKTDYITEIDARVNAPDADDVGKLNISKGQLAVPGKTAGKGATPKADMTLYNEWARLYALTEQYRPELEKIAAIEDDLHKAYASGTGTMASYTNGLQQLADKKREILGIDKKEGEDEEVRNAAVRRQISTDDALRDSIESLIDPYKRFNDLKEKSADLFRRGLLEGDAYGKILGYIAVQTEEVSKKSKPLISDLDKMFDNLTQAVEGYSQRMADALVDFATTGKMSFSDMIGSMLRDLAKMVANEGFKKLIGLGISAIGGFSFGGGISPGSGQYSNGLGGAADGTDSAQGGMTMVGERGPELVNLPKGSQVIPNHKLGGGGQTNIITVNVKGGSTNNETGAAVSQAVVNAMRNVAREEVSKANRPGGLSNPMGIRG